MKKILFIIILFCFSLNSFAQKKNLIFLEGGIPFYYKAEKTYWEYPNGNFSLIPIFNIKYTHQTILNFQVSIGFKHNSFYYSNPKLNYYSDWKSNNIFIGIGYNFYITKNLSLIPSIYCGISKANFTAIKESFLYYPFINNYSINIEDAYPFYFNPEFAVNYQIFNKIHLRLSMGYDNYFLNNMNNNNNFTQSTTIIYFQSFETKIGIGYLF